MAEIELPNPREIEEKAAHPFTRTVAFFVAVYAVGLAFASFGGNNCAKEMFLLKQEEAQAENAAKHDEFNTWNQFQAKSIRESLNRIERERLDAEKELDPTAFAASPLKVKLLARAAGEEARMKLDKDELAAKANKFRTDGDEKVHKFQHELKVEQRKDPYFDFAEVVFQLAIVLASVAMLAEKRWAFVASAVLALFGLVFTVNGFFLLLKIPGIESGH
jgi:hypothetical protein